jgi:hypothetical protein
MALVQDSFTWLYCRTLYMTLSVDRAYEAGTDLGALGALHGAYHPYKCQDPGSHIHVFLVRLHRYVRIRKIPIPLTARLYLGN